MTTEKLIHLTFKNATLAKNPEAEKWREKMENIMNSEENIKIMEDGVVDCALYGQSFALANIESQIVKKTRLDPKDIFLDSKDTTANELKDRVFRMSDYLQIPRPLEVGMRVKSPRLSSHLTEWYLDSIDHEKNSCVVKGISPRWDTPLRVLITNINEVTEWTQN